MYPFSDVKKNLDTFVQFGHDIQLIAGHLESFIDLCWLIIFATEIAKTMLFHTTVYYICNWDSIATVLIWQFCFTVVYLYNCNSPICIHFLMLKKSGHFCAVWSWYSANCQSFRGLHWSLLVHGRLLLWFSRTIAVKESLKVFLPMQLIVCKLCTLVEVMKHTL